MNRDFTYVDDLVKAIFLLSSKEPAQVNKRNEIIKNDSISPVAPFRIVNIGNSKPINLVDFIRELETILGKCARKIFLALLDGDIHKTLSNIDLLKNITKFKTKTSIRKGLTEFIKWYKSYYK